MTVTTDKPTTGPLIAQPYQPRTPAPTDEAASDMPKLYRVQSADILAVVPALIKAKKAFDPLLKDAANPAFKTKYATLAAVLHAADEGLGENDLLLLQQTDYNDAGHPQLFTRLIHSSGEWLGLHYPITPAAERNGTVGPQTLGGALTYARRYSALAILGLAPEDDDGMSASQARRVSGAENTGGLYRPTGQNEAGAPSDEAVAADKASADLAATYSLKIGNAATSADLAEIGKRIANDAALNRHHKGALKVEYDARAVAIKENAAQASQPTLDAQ